MLHEYCALRLHCIRLLVGREEGCAMAIKSDRVASSSADQANQSAGNQNHAAWLWNDLTIDTEIVNGEYGPIKRTARRARFRVEFDGVNGVSPVIVVSIRNVIWVPGDV